MRKDPDLSPAKILEQMDMIYGTSITFWDLNAKLCGLKQGPYEPPKDYYKFMVDISVALKEHHGNQFQLGELAQMKKHCFYAGLWENYKYLVSHLKDWEYCDPVFMLKEISENDESQYLVSTLNKPSRDSHGKASGHYDKQASDHRDKRSHGYTIQAANVQPQK